MNIIECDMNVDFEAPVGYVDPERPGNNYTTFIMNTFIVYNENFYIIKFI